MGSPNHRSQTGRATERLSESQYLLHAGSDRVGALDARSDASAPPLVAKDTWGTLPDLVEAADLIDRGLPVPPGLDNIYVQGASLGGARPKASVRDEHGTLHVAKLSSRGDRFNIPAIEYATLRLAGKAGLRVPSVRLVQVGDRSVMLSRRFDRFWSVPGDTRPRGDSRFIQGHATTGAQEHRIPFVSALTLVGCDEMDSRNMSYADVAACMQRYCRTLLAYDGAAELFKRMIFNIFVSNSDDHLRNLGFLWDAELRSWRLSPVYDVLPRPSLATERFQHLSVGNSGRLATLDNALSSCEAFEVAEGFACTLIAEVWQAVSHWREAFKEYCLSPYDIEVVSSAFRHIDDLASGELRRKLP